MTLHFNPQIRRKLMAKAPSYFWTSAKCDVIYEQVLERSLLVLSEILPTQVASSGGAASLTATSDNVAISACNLGKMYYLYDRPQDRLKQAFLWGKKKLYREFWALRDVSFEVRRGEALGIIGRNGAGKSTLLQILAGTLPPTTGEVQIRGRVAALLELGSGFNPEFTGRENVYLNGAILGFGREEMDERFDEIAAFADIGEFIDQPVKLYSSGMFVRLAFAVQACMEPDVLIVDEALSVGDIFFQQKCYARLDKLLAQNTAIILVSHDMGAIEKYSSETLLLDRGTCVFLGQPNEAVQRFYVVEYADRKTSNSAVLSNKSQGYQNNLAERGDDISDWPDETAFVRLDKSTIIEGQAARCKGIALCNSQGQPCHIFEMGDVANFFYEFQVLEDIDVPVGGVVITNKMNVNVHGKNSAQYLLQAPPKVPQGTCVRFRQSIRLSLAPGEYTFSVGFSTIDAANYADFRFMPYSQYNEKARVLLIVQRVSSFQITLRTTEQELPFHGVADLPGSFKVTLIR
jgi:lipopolysaccharide transport system ATP-binding protein